MYNKQYTAPYKPEISSAVDIRNFDTVLLIIFIFFLKGFTNEPI